MPHLNPIPFLQVKRAIAYDRSSMLRIQFSFGVIAGRKPSAV